MADSLAKASLGTPLSWGQEIKLCSDIQTLQNSENGRRILTPKPECVPWGAWAEQGVVNHPHPTDCADGLRIRPRWGSSGTTPAPECCCQKLPTAACTAKAVLGTGPTPQAGALPEPIPEVQGTQGTGMMKAEDFGAGKQQPLHESPAGTWDRRCGGCRDTHKGISDRQRRGGGGVLLPTLPVT